MREWIILDTGPLVAFLNSRDKHHDWAVAHFGQIQPPLLTCEAVISEASFLLRAWPQGVDSIFELLERKVLEIYPLRIKSCVLRWFSGFRHLPIGVNVAPVMANGWPIPWV